MPRYFFHLSAPGQLFPDTIGADIDDLAAAHFRAVRLANRVMSLSVLADCQPRFRRWSVRVTDEAQRSVINVIFPAHFVPGTNKPTPDNDARTLLQALAATLLKGSIMAGRSRNASPKAAGPLKSAPNNSGSLAKFTAIRRASSHVAAVTSHSSCSTAKELLLS